MDPHFLSRAQLKPLNARRTWWQSRRVCHIPEKGLYFGLRGNVYTCCYNKTHPAGKYPDQSILEIWKGTAIRQQQQAIRKRDMSQGCMGCHDLICAGNINALPIRNYDQYSPGNKGMPAKMDFELFNTCNLECIMCRGEFSSAIRRNREKLPPIPSAYGPEFFDELEAFIPYLKHSHFLGGEPFMIPQYVDLWERMAHLNPGMTLSTQTNGSLLSQRIKGILSKIKFQISVSMDSIEKENYERIRKNAHFETVMANLQWFREYTREMGTVLSFAFCPMPQNWHEIPDVVRFCNEMDMPLMFTTVESPSECSLQALDKDALAEIHASLRKQDLAGSNALQTQNAQTYADLVRQIDGWKSAAQKRASAGIVGQATHLEGYLVELETLLRRDQDVSLAKETVRDIEEKLRFVLAKAAEQGQESQALQKIIGTPHELILRSVPGLDKERLLELFKSFVMPLE